jgi:hypothetical protein
MSSSCGPARPVESGADVLAAMSAPWPSTSWFGTEVPPVTVELVATRDFQWQATELPIPPFCSGKCTVAGNETRCDRSPPRLTNDTREDARGPCLDPLQFSADHAIDGISLTNDDRVLEVRTGARFRVQRIVRPPWVGVPFFTPVHVVLPGCAMPCKSGERRCAIDGLCYQAGSDYCLRCLTRGREACACRDERDNLVSDGTRCDYAISDYSASGKCREGRCVTGDR